jgi:SAM-dependent methyltransferase
MHKSSYLNMRKFVTKYMDEYKDMKIKILDIGAQDVSASSEYGGTYKPLFQNKNWEYYGSDVVQGKNVDIVLSGVYNWDNLKSNTFDVVISGQTFEHIEYVWVTILEIARIMKEGGICCIIAPSSGPEHPHPFDCWRFYPDGFKTLSKFAGLKLIEVYTQWDQVTYPDSDPKWRDTVIVCEKPRMSLYQKTKMYLKNRLTLFTTLKLN